MRNPTSVIATLVVMIVAGCSQGQRTQEPAMDPQEAASRSLSTFQRMVNERNYKGLGFESPDEIKSATLGGPLRVFMVRLDRLKEYVAGIDPNKLLVDGNQVIYPVTVHGSVRSSITVEKPNGGWRGETFGSSNLVKALESARAADSAASKIPSQEYFAVSIPALNLYFLGHRVESRLMLTPIIDDARFKLKAGATLAAEQVLERIVPYAREQKTGPKVVS